MPALATKMSSRGSVKAEAAVRMLSSEARSHGRKVPFTLDGSSARTASAASWLRPVK